VRGDLSHIIGAIHHAREWRSQSSELTYRRVPNARFEPGTITLPTALWHHLVTASEEFCKAAENELNDDCDESGRIDQHTRAFRAVLEWVDDQAYAYSHDGHSFVPQHFTIPTELWHAINLLIDVDDDDGQIDHPDDEV
jgi:hypothetical protein